MLLSCQSTSRSNDGEVTNQLDSVSYWMTASRNADLPVNEKRLLLDKSYKTIIASKIDSFSVRNLSTIAWANFRSVKDTTVFKQQNKKALNIAKRIKDTFALGDLNWNYASYYERLQVYDSAYYYYDIASKYFEKSGYKLENANTLHGMAIIKRRFKDHSGSEVLTFKAIRIFEALERYQDLYSSYSLLALLQNDIYDYEKAIIYNEKSYEYLKKTRNNKALREDYLNNLGYTYLKKGDYKTALSYFKSLLENKNLKKQNITIFAKVIDNYGYAKMLSNDTINVLSNFKEALKVRDSLNDKQGVVISKIRLGQYYALKGDTIKAVSLVKNANTLAKSVLDTRDYLESLKLLSTLDKKNSQLHQSKYIKFSDSLQIEDRKTQDKFTRIEYETDEYAEKNKQLIQKTITLSIFGFALVLIFGLVYFVQIQRAKNKRLILENNQQKANEQLYLIKLRQQERLEEEKINERNRISEELHDGILGKLFGTRVGLGFLKVDGDSKKQKQFHSFLNELQIIEKEIRDVSHELSDNFEPTSDFKLIINDLVESKSKIANFDFKIDFDDNINFNGFSDLLTTNLYRIFQEAFQNIVKYASAKNINLSFVLDTDENITILLKDDGIGFNVKKKYKGIGLKNIRSRVEKLNGTLNIISSENNGTVIRIKIPTNNT